WSVTSFTELRRDGMRAERARRFGAKEEAWVQRCLHGRQGPVVAASDYVSAVADLIRPYVPGKYVALGTDGFGRSDTRAALRAFFEVDARNIAVAALAALESPLLPEALRRYGIGPAPQLAHHLAGRALQRLAADDRRHGDHRRAAPAEQLAHAVQLEDRADAVVRIGRADHHRFQVLRVQRVEHFVGDARFSGPRVLQ